MVEHFDPRRGEWVYKAASIVAGLILTYYVGMVVKDLPIIKKDTETNTAKLSGARFTDEDGHEMLERIHLLEIEVAILKEHNKCECP